MKHLLAAFLLLLVAARVDAQHRLVLDSLYSESVNAWMKVHILVPETPDTFPVLYLLHGWGGNHRDWTSQTKIVDYIKGTNLLVVMPDAHNSFYHDNASDTTKLYEQWIASELPAFIESRYTVDGSRRAIAGLSMGGYGSMMIALNHPDRYAFAAGLSSAISGIHVGGTEVSPNFARITQMFDLHKGSADHPNRARYDFLSRIDAQTPESAPYIYLVHGIQDGYTDFLPGHRRFTDALRAKNLRYEYHEVPGAHNWVFWDTHIQGVLEAMESRFRIFSP
jgi:S-formylglutathione hydrolase FrmB